ncbi:response regulator transcription factor [Dokdonella sp.]|uniref:response regulator transcription factor n=1 Tax=Dokdonella sp. TaxID=2291710 RepID=UPI0037839496
MPHRPSLVVGSGHPLWLRGFLDLAYSLEPITVAGAADNARHLSALLRKHKPDVLVIDVALVVATRQLLDADPHIPRILVVGARPHAGTRPVFGAYCSCGYVNERVPSAAITRLLEVVTACPLPRAGLAACEGCEVRRTLVPPPLPLTERENEVFVRIGLGHRPSQIAANLGIQVKTVDAHRESVKRKLGFGSAADLQAAAFAWRDGDLLPNRQSESRPRHGRRKPVGE